MTRFSNPRLKWLLLFFVAGPILLMLLTAGGIASFFFVRPEVRYLRNAAIENSSGQFEKQVELNVGHCSFAVAQLIGSFLPKLPEEAKVALKSARGAQVSVMKARWVKPDSAGIIRSADRRMRSRGWERIVGVAQRDCTVAVYVPVKMTSARNAKACVLVLNEEQLVCVYGKSDLQPVVNLALKRAHREWPQIAMNAP